ncbi:MAG: DUF3795 domain-containing protein [Kiritimatiellae bacterium]|nr:DUF3795 domain-containing protein [Kiritimatiellia bacterium]MDD5523139.1 DUF3795 domain-containing protein [Kiritimatiellia bacterium]
MTTIKHVTRREFLNKSAAAATGFVGVCMCGRFCGTAEAAAVSGKFQYEAYCGDYCGSCPNMVASEKATKKSEIKCYGCKPNRPNGQKGSCKIKLCALKEKVSSCSKCKEYPCEKLRKYHTSSKSKQDNTKPGYTWLAAYNLERIKEGGVEQWLAQQKERWACPKCKTRFSWTDQKCPKCGGEILTADQEADQLSQKKLPGM